MGHCQSKSKFTPNDEVMGQGAEVSRIAKVLKLTDRDINNLYQYFTKLDTNNSGVISIGEFVHGLESVSSGFLSELCFRLFDRDGDGNLTFVEFIMACWNYITFDETTMATFVFELFDYDKSSKLSTLEVKKMADFIFRDKSNTKMKSDIYALLEESKTQTISLPDFLLLTQKTKLFMTSTNALQRLLREKTLGESAWVRISTDRKVHYKDLSAYEIIGVALPRKMALGNTIRSTKVLRDMREEDTREIPERYRWFAGGDHQDREVTAATSSSV